jgi:hypothetical protein
MQQQRQTTRLSLQQRRLSLLWQLLSLYWWRISLQQRRLSLLWQLYGADVGALMETPTPVAALVAELPEYPTMPVTSMPLPSCSWSLAYHQCTPPTTVHWPQQQQHTVQHSLRRRR